MAGAGSQTNGPRMASGRKVPAISGWLSWGLISFPPENCSLVARSIKNNWRLPSQPCWVIRSPPAIPLGIPSICPHDGPLLFWPDNRNRREGNRKWRKNPIFAQNHKSLRMAFSSFLQLFTPKDRVFYSLFEQVADCVGRMGKLMKEVVAEPDFDKRAALISQVEDQEHVND